MNNRNSHSLVVSRQPNTSISTKTALVLPLFAMLFCSVFAFAQYQPCTPQGGANTFYLNCAFYAGAFDPNNGNANALANENDAIVGGSPYGAATYQNFIWGGGSVAGLFTNNLSGLNPTSAYWEIRSGMSEGSGGALLASGTAGGTSFSHTATNNMAFGYQEYTDAVLTGPVSLAANQQYWFAVVPNDPTNPSRSFNTNTFVLGGQIGKDIDNEQYFNSAFFGANFDSANNWGVFQDFSSGVLQGNVPESSTLIMLGSGLLGVGGLLRRQLFG